MKEVVYIGALFQTAEYIWQTENFDLKGMICEKNRLSDALYTFSCVREIPLYIIENQQELTDVLVKLGNKNIYIMHSFGFRIPVEEMDDYKIFNIHASELPHYKGAQPTYWATINNEKKIGVSIVEITANFDEGPIVDQEKFPYYMWENEKDLHCKLNEIVPRFLQSLDEYLNGQRSFIRVNESGDYYPKVTRKEVYIDLREDSLQLIYNKVRAEAMFGGAKIVLGENTYCLYKILFTTREMEKDYEFENELLWIKYNSETVIKVIEYSKLEGEFKFRGEK